jgi:hypothetical protein
MGKPSCSAVQLGRKDIIIFLASFTNSSEIQNWFAPKSKYFNFVSFNASFRMVTCCSILRCAKYRITVSSLFTLCAMRIGGREDKLFPPRSRNFNSEAPFTMWDKNMCWNFMHVSFTSAFFTFFKFVDLPLWAADQAELLLQYSESTIFIYRHTTVVFAQIVWYYLNMIWDKWVVKWKTTDHIPMPAGKKTLQNTRV